MIVSKKHLSTDLVVVGGGVAGICAAVAAARNGAKVILVQDRPMLGGNASSEIRMWICGAHGSDNREAGLLEELKLLNYHLNPTLTYTLWDHVMYTFVIREKNIRLLLNTTVTGCETENNCIRSISAWDLNSYTEYKIKGKLFADCSGDSILHLSGAEYRMGREASSEFDESFAPSSADKKTMGNSILVQLRKAAKHTSFRAPDWAYHFTDKTFCRRKDISSELKMENFWWMEFGGVKNTITDAGGIRHELLKIALGTWEYIKNNKIGDAEKWELDWIGALPGKRESIRYVGDHILSQKEVEAGGFFPDTVAHGGWTMDDHNPKAFFTREPPTIYHPAPSPFGIPYRSLYSKNIENLFFAGRNISVTHMALSATRVMATCGTLGQAVGTAAAIAIRNKIPPRGVYTEKLKELQTLLQDQDQMIPGLRRKCSELARKSDVSDKKLRNGIDRNIGKTDNGVWFRNGGSCEYTFPEKTTVSSCRVIFDSNFADAKQMRNQNASEQPCSMPEMLAQDYEISVFAKGSWKKVFQDKENIRRCIRIDFPSVRAEKIRLTIHKTWGGPKKQAHVFAFEP